MLDAAGSFLSESRLFGLEHFSAEGLYLAGSGCISIALLREWPSARCVAIDKARASVDLTVRDNMRGHSLNSDNRE